MAWQLHNNFITRLLSYDATQLSVSLSIQFHPSRFLSLLQHFSGKKYISDVRTHNQNSKFFLRKKKCNPLLNEAQMEKSVFERTVKNLSAEESYRSRFLYFIRGFGVNVASLESTCQWNVNKENVTWYDEKKDKQKMICATNKKV